MYKVKVLNSNKNKVESENILQELYTRNKFKYRSVELATADNVTSEDKSLENTLDFEDRKRIIHFNDLSPEFKDIKPKIADTISDNIGFNNIPEELHNRNKSVYESIELCVVDNVDFTDFRFQTHTQNFKDKKINLYLNSSSTKLEEITAMVAENHTTLDNSPFKFLSQTRPDDLPTLMNSTVTDFGKRKTNNSFNAVRYIYYSITVTSHTSLFIYLCFRTFSAFLEGFSVRQKKVYTERTGVFQKVIKAAKCSCLRRENFHFQRKTHRVRHFFTNRKRNIS